MTAKAALKASEVGGKSYIMVCPRCDSQYKPPVEVCPEDGTGLLEVPDAPLLTGQRLDGRYEIGSVIGSGAMGTVYRAFQPSMDRPVAIKVLHPKFTHEPKAVKRFFREAQAASRLIHPNIASVFDFGRCPEGNLYMVMELVEGWTLGDLIYYRAPLAPGLAVTLGMQICDALTHAHQNRTVHRDLKPDNVQLTKLEGRVWAKVLDFGIARMIRDTESAIHNQLSTIEIAGTPAYMSPEQILGKAPDPRTDLYSMGIILFEMLTGTRPFNDDNSVTLCMKQLNDKPPSVSDLVDSHALPPGLSDLVDSLLDKDLTRRPASATALKHALMAFSEGKAHLQLASLLDEGIKTSSEPDPTRLEAGEALVRDTAETVAASEDAERVSDDVPSEPQPPKHRLADVIDRVKNTVHSPFETRPTQACPSCGHRSAGVEDYCSKCGASMAGPGPGVSAEEVLSAEPTTKRGRGSKRSAAAYVHILGGAPKALKSPQLRRWLSEFDDGHTTVRYQKLAVVIEWHSRGGKEVTSTQELLGGLNDLQERARSRQIPLKIGVSLIGDSEPSEALEKARRLAGAAPVGGVVIPTEASERLGLEARPMPNAMLPDGETFRCSVVGASQHETLTGLLFGRDNVLRRLSSLQADATREGLRRVFLEGERGLGKTATARTVMRDHAHLYIRAGHLAQAWPGHTAAQLARVALGCGDGRDAGSIQARLEAMPHRQRRLLSLLLLDEERWGWAQAGDLARVIYELLETVAHGEGFVLVIDDAHLMDPASQVIVNDVCRLASEQPWLVLAAGEAASESSLFTEREWTHVPLRPLGLRACMQFLEAHGARTQDLNQWVELSEGNPLALQLIVEQLSEGRVPPRNVLRALLPNRLTSLSRGQAEIAWLQALFGESVSSSTAVAAASMYLDVAFTPKLKSWMQGRVEVMGGVYASFPYGWSARTHAQHLARAGRYERLGLWTMAAQAYEAAAEFSCTDGAFEHLHVALVAARSGSLEAVEPAYRKAMSTRSAKSHRVARIDLAEALLDASEHVLAERILRGTRQFVDREPFHTGRTAVFLARCAIKQGNIAGAEERLTQARDTVDALRQQDAVQSRALEALVQMVRAEIAIAQGDIADARINLRQASETFRQTDRTEEAVRALLKLGRVELDAGEHQRSADTSRACIALAKAGGLMAELAIAETRLAMAALQLGEREESSRVFRRLLREGGRAHLAEAMLGLSVASAKAGMSQDAIRYAESASAYATTERDRGLVLEAFGLAHQGRMQGIRYLNEAVSMLNNCGEGILVSRIQRNLEGVSADTLIAPESSHPVEAAL